MNSFDDTSRSAPLVGEQIWPCPALEAAYKAGTLAVGQFSELFSTEGVTLPVAEESTLVLIPDTPARRVKLAPNAPPPARQHGEAKALPLWEGAEHTFLGDHAILNFVEGSGPAKNYPLHLDNGLALTYGQVVALGGDFYGLPHAPISDDPTPPLRFFQAYNSLAVNPGAYGEAPKILSVMQIEIDAVNQAIRQGLQPSTAYKALGDTLSGQWNVITGGGSPATEFFPPGRYLALASTNWDHFGWHAITCYKVGHGLAMEYAINAKNNSSPGLRRTMLERAYAMNAFADHYLTDIFSAGHMRAPRKELYDTITPSFVGSLLSRFMHDEDSAYGLNVTNAYGDQWLAYGDKRLLDKANNANLQMVQAAIQVSANEIWNAYQTGAPGRGLALNFVADLAALSNNPSDSSNPSPLFIYRDGTTERRDDPANRFDYSWTSNWWGWSTLSLLKDLPEFENLGDGNIPVTLDTNILQLWNNGGYLSMWLFGLNANNQYGLIWGGSVGGTANTLQWLKVDRNGDDQTEILQLWDNNGILAMTLYSPNPNGPGYVISWSNPNMGEGSGAVQWLTVDRNGDGKTEVRAIA